MLALDLSPDLIFHNATVYTLAERQPTAQALAIKDGRIVAVGADVEIQPLAGPATQRIDLAGRTVLPSVFDSHNHLLQVGVKLTRLRLDECRSPGR